MELVLCYHASFRMDPSALLCTPHVPLIQVSAIILKLKRRPYP